MSHPRNGRGTWVNRSMNDLMVTPMTKWPIPAWAEPAFRAGGSGAHIEYALPEHIYHSSKGLLSKSALCVAADPETGSLEKFLHYMTSPSSPPTPAMVEGSALHKAVLEPDLFGSCYVALPEFGDMRSSTNRAKLDHWILEHVSGTGIIVLTAEQMDRVMAQASALRANADVRRFLQHAVTEVSVAWTHPSGLRMKCRADAINIRMGIAGDLKRALCASPNAFRRVIDNRMYHVQDVLYTMGLRKAGFDIKNFGFIACEPEPPYAIGMYQCLPPTRLAAEDIVNRWLDRIAAAIENQRFPGYTDGFVDIDIPEYALSRAQREAEADEANAANRTFTTV